METPEAAPSLQLDSSEMIDGESGGQSSWEPGPNLKSPGWMRCKLSILGYALKHHRIQIFIMALALGLIIDLVLRWDELRPPMQIQISMPMASGIIDDILYVLRDSPMFFQDGTIASPKSPSTWVDWWVYVQSLLGGGTLLVALFVWYGEIREDWENALPKRMSVFFLHQGLPVIICRYIWLAGEGDLRAWGQQVAAQAAGEHILIFYPNVRAEAPKLITWTNGNICRHYEICFELRDMDIVKKQNLFLEDLQSKNTCRYQNMASGSNTAAPVKLADLRQKAPASAFPFQLKMEEQN